MIVKNSAPGGSGCVCCQGEALALSQVIKCATAGEMELITQLCSPGTRWQKFYVVLPHFLKFPDCISHVCFLLPIKSRCNLAL